jgi:hypothetical protein
MITIGRCQKTQYYSSILASPLSNKTEEGKKRGETQKGEIRLTKCAENIAHVQGVK